MTPTVALFVPFLCVLIAPTDAWAWGPITHIVHGTTVLENLYRLSPAMQALLTAHADRYLYGCVGADIIQAKAYTRSVATHCHRWPVAWRIVGSAKTDGELAFAWGYMTHLAADVLSHNHFVPLHLVLSFAGRTSGHAYWEARVDGLQDEHHASRLRARAHHAVRGLRRARRSRRRAHAVLVPHEQANLRLADGAREARSLAAPRENRERPIAVSSRRARPSTPTTAPASPQRSISSRNRKQSYTQAQDPTGKETLERAFVLRRKLRQLERQRGLPEGLSQTMADSLAPADLIKDASRAA